MNTSLDNLPFEKDLKEALKALFHGTEDRASDLGFEFCAYHLRFPLPITRPAIATFNNYPAAWNARYQEKNYLAVDPTFKHAQHYQSALVWSNCIFVKTPELWNDMQAHGLNVGWAHPARDAKNVVGMLTVSRSANPITPEEIQEKQALLAWLAQSTHHAFSRQLAPRLMPSINAGLSAREIDVLRWTAEGKTAGEISEILDISERTVNYHANNASFKLGVANKTAAAAHAALLGIL